MFLSYFKFSLRLLARNPFFTFINVAGLSVGFVTFLLLYPYAAHELKSDQYHKDSERIARLSVDFKWRFLDDQINQAYTNEKIARNQILMFTVLAIGIACLGLIAMMTQKVIEKTKEIGIRKILGAKDIHIGQLLVHNLVIQLLVASLFAAPVAFYLGNQYLQKYSERTTIHWWYYVMPLVILLTIMFIAISSMLWRAARTNPVESLRYE